MMTKTLEETKEYELDSMTATPDTEYFSDFKDYDEQTMHSQDSSKNEDTETFSNWYKFNIFMFFEKQDTVVLFIGVFFTMLTAVIPVAITIMLGRVFDQIAQFLVGNYASIGAFLTDLGRSCLAVALIGIGATLFGWWSISAFMMLGERQQARCRELLYSSMFKKDFEWFEKNPELNGDLIQVNRCIEEFRAGISEVFCLFLRSIFTMIALLVTSFLYSWRLTLIIMASFPLILTSTAILSVFIEKYIILENGRTADAIKRLDWNLTSYKWIKVNNSKQIELSNFNDIIQLSRQAFNKLKLYTCLNMGIMKTLSLMMFVQSFWYGSFLVKHDINSSGDVLSSFYACLSVSQIFDTLSTQIILLQKGHVSLMKVLAFIGPDSFKKTVNSSKESVEQSEYFEGGFIPKHPIQGEIKFSNISFKYPSRDEYVLKNVTIHIPPNRLTFLVGKSGSGKSTLGALLLRLYNLHHGDVTLDDYSVSKLDKDWLSSQITLVQQNCILFNGTIKENISLGLAHIHDDLNSIDPNLIKHSIQLSLLQQLIFDLPNGVDTKIGNDEEAVSLSGGQRQKLALARARLRNTPILILDESISAIDIIQRDLLIKAIKNWRRGKTTIIMTHEFNQIDNDDLLYLIENGEVVEYGLKRELLNNEDSKFKLLESFEREESDTFDKSMNTTREPKEKFDEFIFYNRPKSTLIRSIFFNTVQFDDDGDDNRLSIAQLSRAALRRRKVTDAEKDPEKKPNDGNDDNNNEAPPIGLFGLLKELAPFITTKFKCIVVLGLFVAMINSTMTSIFSFCFSKLIAGIVPDENGLKEDSYILKWSLILTGISIADGVTEFIYKFTLNVAAESMVNNLRSTSFKVILNQEMKWFENCKPNEISSLLLNDSRELRSIVSDLLSIACSIVIILLIGCIWSIVSGWKLALVGISFLPLFVITSILYAMFLQKYENRYKEAVIQLENFIHESIVGMKTVLCLNLKQYFSKRFTSKLDDVLTVGMKRAVVVGFGISLPSIMVYSCQGTLLYYGLKLVAEGEYTMVQVMQVVMLIVFSIGAIASMLTSAPSLNRGLRAGWKILKLVKMDEDPNETAGYLKPSFGKRLEPILFDFDNVTFSYPSLAGKPVLKEFNLQIMKNEITCIVGESGCGKSTLLSLMLRLYTVNDGSLDFLGFDISKISLSFLRSSIGIVTQDHFFFDGTIRENLIYNSPIEISDNEIYSTLDSVGLHDFISTLPLGLDTQIGNSANLLISGGQSQRLSIVRALLRKPKILILDECTSSLDPENSKRIRDLLSQLKKSMSIILISHRRDLMVVTDRILCLKSGRIVEDGSFRELFNKRGEFYRLVHLNDEK